MTLSFYSQRSENNLVFASSKEEWVVDSGCNMPTCNEKASAHGPRQRICPLVLVDTHLRVKKIRCRLYRIHCGYAVLGVSIASLCFDG